MQLPAVNDLGKQVASLGTIRGGLCAAIRIRKYMAGTDSTIGMNAFLTAPHQQGKNICRPDLKSIDLTDHDM